MYEGRKGDWLKLTVYGFCVVIFRSFHEGMSKLAMKRSLVCIRLRDLRNLCNLCSNRELLNSCILCPILPFGVKVSYLMASGNYPLPISF